jgi:hypothetical protein
MPQQVRDDLAHFLNQIISFKLRRPPGRPRTVGAAARMLMHWKGDGLRLWTANLDVERIKAAWNHPEAAKQLAESDPDLAVAASQKEIVHTLVKAAELAAAYRGVNQQKLTNYRRCLPGIGAGPDAELASPLGSGELHLQSKSIFFPWLPQTPRDLGLKARRNRPAKTRQGR